MKYNKHVRIRQACSYSVYMFVFGKHVCIRGYMSDAGRTMRAKMFENVREAVRENVRKMSVKVFGRCS